MSSRQGNCTTSRWAGGGDEAEEGEEQEEEEAPEVVLVPDMARAVTDRAVSEEANADAPMILLAQSELPTVVVEVREWRVARAAKRRLSMVGRM